MSWKNIYILPFTLNDVLIFATIKIILKTHFFIRTMPLQHRKDK